MFEHFSKINETILTAGAAALLSQSSIHREKWPPYSKKFIYVVL